MGHPSLVAAVLLISCASARAEEAPKKPFGMKIFDRNTKPTPEGNNALESVNPVSRPSEGSAPEASSPTKLSQAPLARKTVQPDPSDDEAAQSGQQLYDGAGAAAASKSTPAPGAAAPGAAAQPGLTEQAGAAPASEVFVALDLDLKAHPGQYKDAVADLGRAAAFRPDHRFDPGSPSSDRVSLWGWMPPDRLAQAMEVAGVTRLRVEPARLAAPRPMPGQQSADSNYIVGIRVPDQARADETGKQVIKELGKSGFRLLRSIGTQVAPGGELVLVVEGTLPVRGLPRVMAHAEVLKVVPAESGEPIAAAESSSRGFLRYASQRAPLLLALTLLLLIPAFGGSLLKLCEFFIPYRR